MSWSGLEKAWWSFQIIATFHLLQLSLLWFIQVWPYISCLLIGQKSVLWMLSLVSVYFMPKTHQYEFVIKSVSVLICGSAVNKRSGGVSPQQATGRSLQIPVWQRGSSTLSGEPLHLLPPEHGLSPSYTTHNYSRQIMDTGGMLQPPCGLEGEHLTHCCSLILTSTLPVTPAARPPPTSYHGRQKKYFKRQYFTTWVGNTSWYSTYPVLSTSWVFVT